MSVVVLFEIREEFQKKTEKNVLNFFIIYLHWWLRKFSWIGFSSTLPMWDSFSKNKIDTSFTQKCRFFAATQRFALLMGASKNSKKFPNLNFCTRLLHGTKIKMKESNIFQSVCTIYILINVFVQTKQIK